MSAISVQMRPRIITVLLAVLALVVGGSAVALSAGTVVTASATGANLTRFVSDANPAETTSTSFQDVPNATTTITVPANTKAIIDARFSASSTCVGPVTGAKCFVRILFGNVEGHPGGVNLSTFDSELDSSAGAPQQGHMIERFRGPLGPGTYVVKVQFMVPNSGATLALVNWLLVVQRFKV